MKTIYGIGKSLEKSNWPVVTLGVFDGVHRGHLKVIKKTVSWAKEKGGKSIVLTFSRSPKVVLGKRPSSIITSLEHRLNIFNSLGVDYTVVMEFNGNVADIKADDFVKNILYDWIGIKGMVLGYNCSFGKDREGDKSTILDLAKRYNFEVFSCEPVKLAEQIISSTLIREAIMHGDLNRAEDMLGRSVSILGRVVSGSKRGSKLLFPTANLDLHHEVIPPRGVYGTLVKLDDKEFYAITNIGIRPTFEGESFERDSNIETVVEVHILDFSGSIYGKDLEVLFISKIREEVKFNTIDELKKQIEKDRDLFLQQVSKLKEQSSFDKLKGGKNCAKTAELQTQKFLDMSNTYSYNASKY